MGEVEQLLRMTALASDLCGKDRYLSSTDMDEHSAAGTWRPQRDHSGQGERLRIFVLRQY